MKTGEERWLDIAQNIVDQLHRARKGMEQVRNPDDSPDAARRRAELSPGAQWRVLPDGTRPTCREADEALKTLEEKRIAHCTASGFIRPNLCHFLWGEQEALPHGHFDPDETIGRILSEEEFRAVMGGRAYQRRIDGLPPFTLEQVEIARRHEMGGVDPDEPEAILVLLSR